MLCKALDLYVETTIAQETWLRAEAALLLSGIFALLKASKK